MIYLKITKVHDWQGCKYLVQICDQPSSQITGLYMDPWPYANSRENCILARKRLADMLISSGIPENQIVLED